MSRECRLSDLGSPPRMRGKPGFRGLRSACQRITPADAGKTTISSGVSGVSTDHPRGCGENCAGISRPSNITGSPPRMRGKPSSKKQGLMKVRITPADAGKTRFKKRYGYFIYGSPPRMRGKPFADAFREPIYGITPADAGKTLKRSFRNQPFCSRAVQISFNFSNSLNVSLQSGSAR